MSSYSYKIYDAFNRCNAYSDAHILEIAKRYCNKFVVDDPSIKESPYIMKPYYTKEARELIFMVNDARVEDLMFRTADFCKNIAKHGVNLKRAEVFTSKESNKIGFPVINMDKKHFKLDIFKPCSDVETEFIRLFYTDPDAIDMVIFNRPDRENAIPRLRSVTEQTIQKPLKSFLTEVMFKTSSDVEYAPFMTIDFDESGEVCEYGMGAEIVQGRDTQVVRCGRTLTTTIED